MGTDRSGPAWLMRLRRESERWVEQGLISPEQQRAILDEYAGQAHGGQNRTVRLLSLLGILLIGSGVLLFIAANWSSIPAWLKTAGIFVAVAVTHWRALRLAARPERRIAAERTALLGTLLYGAGIWLLAQIFHLPYEYPTGFFLWGVGALAMAWALSSKAHLYLSAALLSTWGIGAQALDSSGFFFLPVAVLFLFPLARRLRTLGAEAVVLGGLIVWLISTLASPLDSPQLIPAALLLTGSTLFLAGVARLAPEGLYSGLGALVAMLGSYLLAVIPPQEFARDAGGGAPILFVVGALIAAGIFIGMAGLRLSWDRQPARGAALMLVLLPAIAAVISPWLGGVPRTVGFALLLLVQSTGTALYGIIRHRPYLLNIGLIAFTVHIYTWFFNAFYTAMGRSLFFVTAGLFLVAASWGIERRRRRWLATWKHESQ